MEKPDTFIIATSNSHKVEEIKAILGGSFRYLTLKEFPGAPKVVEDANTFAGNATKKAVELACWLGETSRTKIERLGKVFVLADDSGLEVDAIGGRPGVHSARFASLDSGEPGNSPDAENNAKLLRLLKDVPAEKRTARFRCVVAIAPVTSGGNDVASRVCDANEAELQARTFDGTCEGRIAFGPSGSKGFGYDPLFVPDGFKESFAELGDAVKNRLSHRSKALAAMRVALGVK